MNKDVLKSVLYEDRQCLEGETNFKLYYSKKEPKNYEY